MSGRFSFPRAELRSRTVRGALVTGAFLIGIDGLVVAQGLIVTALLGPELIGLYGIVTVTVTTIVALKRVGIDEKFVQQEDGGEEEFARAFTLELALAAAFTAALCALAPLVSSAYGDDRLLGLMLAMAWLPLAMALQAPLWIFFRRMEYGRQRGRRRGDHQRHRGGEDQLERERPLELLLLPLLVLLDVGLVDPHALERDDRDGGRRHDPVQADRLRPEQHRHDQPLEQDEPLGARQEQPVDHRAACGAPAQLAARECEALFAHGAIVAGVAARGTSGTVAPPCQR